MKEHKYVMKSKSSHGLQILQENTKTLDSWNAKSAQNNLAIIFREAL